MINIKVPASITKLATHREAIAYNDKHDIIAKLNIPVDLKEIVIDDSNSSIVSVCFHDFFHNVLMGSHGHEIR